MKRRPIAFTAKYTGMPTARTHGRDGEGRDERPERGARPRGQVAGPGRVAHDAAAIETGISRQEHASGESGEEPGEHRHGAIAAAGSQAPVALKCGVLDDAEAVAEGILHGRDLDAIAHVGDGLQRRGAEGEEPLERLVRVRHPPQRLRAGHARRSVGQRAPARSPRRRSRRRTAGRNRAAFPRPARTRPWLSRDPRRGRWRFSGRAAWCPPVSN